MAEGGEPVVDVPAEEEAVEEKPAEKTGSAEENSSATPSSKVKDLIDEKNMNVKNLACARCQSIVLRPGLAKATQKKFFLPHMKVKTANQEPNDGEELEDFWLIEGMYTFENVGFTNTVKSIKYLICADCEVGPIGYHDLETKENFYVAVERVVYT
ncbi:guanine nucleotide exchange factor MSS4-like [Asterias rubens]|uniref:guanine nucleotide exchange factor MSS4-like n=1 Tax=Asterias rubens TaxID=7604 RepID=UPI001455472C|nr:guanine nucleotide exchange factor MSS4-like [Asterias rubens]